MTALLNIQVPAAGTYTTDAVGDLGKVTAANLQCRFIAGSGGTSVKAYVQTTLDGSFWYDIACFAHTTSNIARAMSCSGMAGVSSPATLTDGALTDDTAVGGFLGSQYRVKYVVVGAYSGATLAVHADFKN